MRGSHLVDAFTGSLMNEDLILYNTNNERI